MTADPRIEIAALVMAKGAKNWKPWAEDAEAVITALDAAAPEPDGNTLPMDQLPEGWRFNNFWRHGASLFECEIVSMEEEYFGTSGYGPTPRAAMLNAIEAAKEPG